MSLRVVGGSFARRRLEVPSGSRVRPTAERVREALFDSLQGRVALTSARVVDLFAGSGALGIEALSRGAPDVTFVERDPACLVALRANLRALGWDPVRGSLVVDPGGEPARARVLRSDVHAYLRGGSSPVDVAFCDPPYAFDGWPELLGMLRADVAVVEAGRQVDAPPEWEVVRVRRYGSTVLHLMRAVRSVRSEAAR